MYTRAWPASKQPGGEWQELESETGPAEWAIAVNALSDNGEMSWVERTADGRDVLCHKWQEPSMSGPAFWYFIAEED